jgi:hypothetical protein
MARGAGGVLDSALLGGPMNTNLLDVFEGANKLIKLTRHSQRQPTSQGPTRLHTQHTLKQKSNTPKTNVRTQLKKNKNHSFITAGKRPNRTNSNKQPLIPATLPTGQNLKLLTAQLQHKAKNNATLRVITKPKHSNLYSKTLLLTDPTHIHCQLKLPLNAKTTHTKELHGIT